jgi:hypothetical protein
MHVIVIKRIEKLYDLGQVRWQCTKSMYISKYNVVSDMAEYIVSTTVSMRLLN